MSQQATLTEDSFYPVIDESESDEETVSLEWNRGQALLCGLCGGSMRRMAAGKSFSNHTDINYSCRNSHCGGSSAAGGSALTVLVETIHVEKANGELETRYQLKDGSSVGMPLKKNSHEFRYNANVDAMVHPQHFDVEQWSDLSEQ